MIYFEDFIIYSSELIGQGSQANIVRAVRKNDSKQYCAKIIQKQASNIDKELKIIRIMKNKLNENLVATYEANYATDQKCFILIMERCEKDLQQQIQEANGRRYTEDEAVNIMRQLLNGYSVLYANSIIHRDIKPANILISKGVFKLTDFGISKIYEAGQKYSDLTKCGTPVFKAPELWDFYTYKQRDLEILDKQSIKLNAHGVPKYMDKDNIAATPNIGHKIDIYSFGLLFYHLLTFDYPFALDPQGISLQNFIKSIETAPFKIPKKYNISQKISLLIERMMLSSPVERISFEEIAKMPEFNLKIPIITNYKRINTPLIQPLQILNNNQNIPIVDSNKDLIEWFNYVKQLFIYKCNENQLVSTTHRNYGDGLLQLQAMIISQNGSKQLLEQTIQRIIFTQNSEIPFTIQVSLQKSYYIGLFVNVITSLINQKIFVYDKTKEYGEEYVKFIYICYKLRNRQYDYNLLDNQIQSFKQQVLGDQLSTTKAGMKSYLDQF